ncbi:MAG TPA: bacterial transcriptional activator domain-containing protein [bacterium]|nr:bacterial transcriptional activator domain-containing protein [bacterium]
MREALILRTFLALLVAMALLAAAAPLRAADVTDVPKGVSTEAVKAFKRGLELHKAKKWASAIPEYERAIALGGRFPEAFNNLAYCYRKTGMIERSIELYKVAIALRPTFPQAHDYLARAYLAMGDRSRALREYEIVRRLDAKLAACLSAAIQRNDPDYHDMPWGGAFILSLQPVG